MAVKTDNLTCDIAVIGGGPAGMMAAGTAALAGRDVLLVEKNRKPGRKLMITGKGRCNITNSDTDPRTFLAHFGARGRYLHSSLSRFGVDDSLNFFTERGLEIKVERGNRVFPASDSAGDVLRILEEYMRESGVRVKTGCAVREITADGGRVTGIVTDAGTITARHYIFCTGGLSYPTTGSTGDGLEFARALGHTIVPTRPSLVPVLLKETWPGEIEGLGLRNVSVTLLRGGKSVAREFGETMFTAGGVSGPVIIDLSKIIGELLPARLEFSIDLKPALDHRVLDERIRRDFGENPTRMFKNSLGRLLPASIIPVMVRLSAIDPDKSVSHLARDERKKIVHLLKDLRLRIAGLEGFDRAIITAGGVSLDEIDMRTMRSRIIGNLFFAGEMIDIDGPTGGFNLQVCWTTGYCAGAAAATE